jgi:hypothetical protein
MLLCSLSASTEERNRCAGCAAAALPIAVNGLGAPCRRIAMGLARSLLELLRSTSAILRRRVVQAADGKRRSAMLRGRSSGTGHGRSGLQSGLPTRPCAGHADRQQAGERFVALCPDPGTRAGRFPWGTLANGFVQNVALFRTWEPSIGREMAAGTRVLAIRFCCALARRQCNAGRPVDHWLPICGGGLESNAARMGKVTNWAVGCCA